MEDGVEAMSPDSTVSPEGQRATELVAPHRLDAWFVQQYRNQVFACATRRELDQLTRYLWQRYGSGVSATVNNTALEDLKRSILVRREQLEQAPYVITEEQLQALWDAIFDVKTRRGLDNLTRRIWRRYGRKDVAGANRWALDRLRQAVLMRRSDLVDGGKGKSTVASV
jgi:hypothetical protein